MRLAVVSWNDTDMSRRFSMSLVKRASFGLPRIKTTRITWLAGYGTSILSS